MTHPNTLRTPLLIGLAVLLLLGLPGCSTNTGAQPLSGSPTPVRGVEPGSPGGDATTSPATPAPTNPAQPTQSGPDQPVSSDTPVTSTPPAANRGRVTGRVTDAQARPLERAAVTVSEGTTAVPDIAILTGADGRFVWSLPPGTFRIAVYKDGYESASQSVDVTAGKEIGLNFVLQTQ